jgi:hypothetical protein
MSSSLQAEADLLFALTCARLGACELGAFHKRVKEVDHVSTRGAIFKSLEDMLRGLEGSCEQLLEDHAGVANLEDKVESWRSAHESAILLAIFSLLLDDIHAMFGTKIDVDRIRQIFRENTQIIEIEQQKIMRTIVHADEPEAGGGGDGASAPPPADDDTPAAAGGGGAVQPAADDGGSVPAASSDGSTPAAPSDAGGGGPVQSADTIKEAEIQKILVHIRAEGWIHDRLTPRQL